MRGSFFGIATIAGLVLSAGAQAPVPVREAYDSWKLAGKNEGGQVATATEINAPEGFEVSLIRVAEESEGSWVGMTFGESGELYVAIEERGILRFDLDPDHSSVVSTTLVEDELEECRGLLWAYDSLYANANNSKGFYRLKDEDGDGVFESKQLLLETEVGGAWPQSPAAGAGWHDLSGPRKQCRSRESGRIVPGAKLCRGSAYSESVG